MKLSTCRACNDLIYGCPMHTHTDWELILQCVGEARANVADTAFSVTPGDLVIVPPNTPHNCESDTLFGDMYIALRDCDLPQKPFVMHDSDGSIRTLMNMILKLFAEKEAYYETITDSLVDAVLQYVHKSVRVKVQYPFVADFKNLLYQNLSNSDFDMGNEIKKSGYNPDYFRRCFKKETGRAPLEYLTHLRIEQARELLCQDDPLSVETVAARCGFADSFYFSTCFKKHTGLSPLAYKKAHKR